MAPTPFNTAANIINPPPRPANTNSALLQPQPQQLVPSPTSTFSRLSTGSNNTYVMTGTGGGARRNSRKRGYEPYLPKIITTVGQKPACLVNASVTYVGNDQIYAFGGFDQYTDEVYNHVLRLDLNLKQWSLVDNYGDIPGVRMGHTACLWRDDKLLVFGGENEHRSHLHDVIIFDLKTAHWTLPELHGVPPRGRARHSAVIHNEKLFISGGMTGQDNSVLDDLCYLDLRTWTWSRPWRFVPRYDHSTWIWGGRLWVSGGMTEDMERTSEIWSLDLKGVPAFESVTADEQHVVAQPASRAFPMGMGAAQGPPPAAAASGQYAANSSSVQVTPGFSYPRTVPVAPGSISSLKFISDPNLPTQNIGVHFHVFSSGRLLDFVTPATVMSSLETSLSAFDLDSLRWQKLADGKDLFNPGYRWHYCCLNPDGTQAWLLGCPNQAPRNGPNVDSEEYLSDVLHLDLRKLGLLGNKMTAESRVTDHAALPVSDSHMPSHLSAIGADLARTFDVPPEQGSGADFVITANLDDGDEDDQSTPTPTEERSGNTSKPIHVHRFLLCARWPHFARLYAAQMSEFHTKKMHIPEPYAAVRAFLYYLYTDSIAPTPMASITPTSATSASMLTNVLNANTTPTYNPGPDLEDVAGMLVMSNMYDMPRLHHLCVSRLTNEISILSAALIFSAASTAQEHYLKRRAASFCMLHWGRIVRTDGFRRLSREAMLELCEEVDDEGRIVSGDELEAVGALGGARLSVGFRRGPRRTSELTAGEDLVSADEEEGMEIA